MRHHWRNAVVLFASFLLIAAATADAPNGGVLRVDDDAPPGGDGLTWDTAFDDLQDALEAVAGSGGGVAEIRVAGGTYVPSELRDPNEPRSATYLAPGGVTIAGGYAGIGAKDPDARDIDLYETVLSGDLAGDDGPPGSFKNNDENCYHVVTVFQIEQIATLDGLTVTGGNAIEDFSNFLDQWRGGGVYVAAGALLLQDCTIRHNSAVTRGGGLYANVASVTLFDCKFSENRADREPPQAGNAEGGALHARFSTLSLTRCEFTQNSTINSYQFGGGGIFAFRTESTLTDCTFAGNTSDFSAGGLYANEGQLTLIDCKFEANSAAINGGALVDLHGEATILVGCSFVGNHSSKDAGAMSVAFSDPALLVSCTFLGNTAAMQGGAVRAGESEQTFVNCLFSGNAASQAAGAIQVKSQGTMAFVNSSVYGNSTNTGTGGILIEQGSDVTVINSILWGNSSGNATDEAAQITLVSGDLSLDYTCVQGLTGRLGGEGNIGDDPLFVDPDGLDDIPGTEDDDLRLSPGSPCIDAADNTAVPPDEFDLDDDGDTDEPTPFDLDGNPRFVDDPDTKDTGNGDPPIVDMGAYEFQGAGIIEASLDIKPGSCPNSFNRNSHGMLAAAILGSDDFDAAQIDISSVMLSRADGIGGSVAPHEGRPGPHSVLDDVATPFAGEPCDCHELGGDGLIDLVMHFSSPELVETLELNDLPADAQVPLIVSGELIDGSPFTATDCIRLVPPGDMNGDGSVGVADFLILLASWGPCPDLPETCPADLDLDGNVGVADFLILLANWG